MNRLFLLLSFLTISRIANAQIKALTENGKEVLLLENGTWKYSTDSSDNLTKLTDTIPENKTKFSKSSGATFLVKSNIFNVGVFMNPKKWTFASHKENESNPEFRFGLKAGEGYVLMATEKTQIDLENMRKIALMNAQKASVDVREAAAEYRNVNNNKVLFLKLQGTVSGIKFVYLGYYFSNPNGTVQLIGYSSQQYFEQTQKEIEEFLNGLVEVKK